MQNWRFKNMLPFLESAIDDKYQKAARLITSPLPKGLDQAHIELNDYLLFDLGMVTDRRYGFGCPMQEVFDSIALAVLLKIRRLEIIISVVLPHIKALSTQDIEKYPLMMLTLGSLMEEALLIDRIDLLHEGKTLIEELIKSPWPTGQDFDRNYAEVILFLAGSQRNADVEVKWDQFRQRQCNDLKDYKYVELIIRNDSVKFNSLLKQHILDRFGSERTRIKRKNIAPNERFSREILGTLALALHNGIPLTIKDEAIPIHEFPIAQRPEIKALLPE